MNESTGQEPPARLVERLRAGLDERERVAQEAEPGPWRLVQDPTSGDLRIVADDDGVVVDHGGVCDGEHIVLNGPDWVLADVAAKRRIVARYADALKQAADLREQYQGAARTGVNAAHLLEEAQRWDGVATILEGPVRDLAAKQGRST